MVKRFLDLIVSTLGLVFLAPVFVAIALWIKWDSPGPVFFRQERVGRRGKLFRIHKFRTMVPNAEARGGLVSPANDPRVTRAGAFLREHKLDELPQLIDVWRGAMSLVGPRPEVPKYVALYPDDIRAVVLSVRPGITDRASIQFLDEGHLLAAAADPDEVYRREILPKKITAYQRYVRERSFWGDVKIIRDTLFEILR